MTRFQPDENAWSNRAAGFQTSDRRAETRGKAVLVMGGGVAHPPIDSNNQIQERAKCKICIKSNDNRCSTAKRHEF
jgi:hypothetical protein